MNSSFVSSPASPFTCTHARRQPLSSGSIHRANVAAAKLELSQSPRVHGAEGSLLGLTHTWLSSSSPNTAPAPLTEWTQAGLHHLVPALKQPNTIEVGTFIVGGPPGLRAAVRAATDTSKHRRKQSCSSFLGFLPFILPNHPQHSAQTHTATPQQGSQGKS